MDVWDKKKRSEVMSKIRSANTKPEIKLRKELFSKGFRYRINYKKLPGNPYIVLPKYKTVILVNGCFWHGHEGCKYFYTPKTNTDFWVEKIGINKNRDGKNIDALLSAGWNIIIVWECTIAYTKDISAIVELIQAFLQNILCANTQVQVLTIE